MARPADVVHRPPGHEATAYSADFAEALLNPDTQTPDCVTGPAAKAADRRFNVYRNNVSVSLVNALAEVFPATQRIVGRDFFRAMALVHVRETPPRSPLLFEYGRDFPVFIDTFEHTRDMPWLGDVARIERAWLDAYHSADARPMPPDALSRIAPDDLGEARFRPHPATRIVRSAFPAVTIFSANRKEGPFEPIKAEGAEDALIARPALNVHVHWLPPSGATFIARLVTGATLGEAAAAATAEHAGFDLAGSIVGMIETGAFADVLAPADCTDRARGDGDGRSE